MAPLTDAVAEQLMAENCGVKIAVGQSGTGGGFERFCAGETDISDASRRSSPKRSTPARRTGSPTRRSGSRTTRSRRRQPENPVNCLTVDQLGAIWGPDQVSSWSEIPDLDEDFDEELALFGPGTDSGTFDYFTEEINGEEGATPQDYNNVGENDNPTVTGVEGRPAASATSATPSTWRTKAT